MIVDFQHHYTPRELCEAKGEAGALGASFDENDNPAYLFNPLLSDLDAHIRMMDKAGIDLAVLSCADGYDNPDRAACAFINDKMKQAAEDYPGRFIGLAHVPALDEAEMKAELARCVDELGFPGVVIGSELQDRPLDDPALDLLWREVSDRGIYVFVHPLAKVIGWNRMDADDLGRVLGWEFSLAVAALRLMNGGATACAFINDKMKQAAEDYPGRFIGLAHVPALDEAEMKAELARCVDELGFPGVVIDAARGLRLHQ